MLDPTAPPNTFKRTFRGRCSVARKSARQTSRRRLFSLNLDPRGTNRKGPKKAPETVKNCFSSRPGYLPSTLTPRADRSGAVFCNCLTSPHLRLLSWGSRSNQVPNTAPKGSKHARRVAQATRGALLDGFGTSASFRGQHLQEKSPLDDSSSALWGHGECTLVSTISHFGELQFSYRCSTHMFVCVCVMGMLPQFLALAMPPMFRALSTASRGQC